MINVDYNCDKNPNTNLDDSIFDDPRLHLISNEDLGTLKIKLNKSHRKEADWTIIKNILANHSLLTATPITPTDEIYDVNGVLCEDGYLIAFTNLDECKEHMKNNFESLMLPSPIVNIRNCFWEELIEIADSRKMDIIIDPQVKLNAMFLIYYHEEKEIKAVMIG